MKTLLVLLTVLIGPLTSAASSPEPKLLLQKVVDNYATIENYRSNTTVEFHIYTPYRNMMISHYEITASKPNKFRITGKSDPVGRDTISDGENLWITIPSLKQYRKTDAPASLAEGLSPDFSSASEFGSERFVLFTFFNKENRYLKSEELDITSLSREIEADSVTNIILINGDQMNMKLWIDEDRLLITKIEFDMQELIKKEHPGAEASTRDLKMTYAELHDNIVTGQPIEEETFVFRNRKEFNEVQSLDAAFVQEPVRGNPGTPFIDFKFTPVGEDKTLRLSDFKGQSIILAFIDSTKSAAGNIAETLNEVYSLKEGEDLKIIAVDISGSEKALEKFADKHQTAFTIVPDRKGKIREEYSLSPSDTPAVYIISSDGIIRQIYTGYFAGFNEHLIEDLRFIESAGYGASQYRSEKGLSMQWNHKVNVVDFVTTEGKAAVLTPSNEIDIISTEGKATDIFKLSQKPADRILVASGEDELFYIVYRNGMNNIRSYSTEGKLLWETSAKYPISDIKIINGPDSVMIIAALNGPTGPACFSSDGEELWVSQGPPYTSRVAVGNFDGGGKIAAITNSGDTLHILDINGETLSSTEIEYLYADYIEAVPFGNGEEKSTLFIAGNSGGNKILKYLKEDLSESSWETILGSPGSSDITGISPHPHKEIYAITVNNGSLYIFNRDGEIVAEKANLGFGVKSGWLEVERNYYLLLTGSVDKGLSAYITDIKE